MTTNLLNIRLSNALWYGFGRKLFEEIDNITGVKVTRVHPIEGVTTEVSFTSEIRGEGRFPSGENLGSGIMTKYPHGMAHRKSKIVEGGKIKGLTIVTGFTNSQKLSWLNNLIMTLELDGSVFSQKFKATGYEWK